MIATSSGMNAGNFKVKLLDDLFGDAASPLDREQDSARGTLFVGNLFGTSAADEVAVAAFKDGSPRVRDPKTDGALQEVFQVFESGVGVFQISWHRTHGGC
jgi:hypothetical protein